MSSFPPESVVTPPSPQPALPHVGDGGQGGTLSQGEAWDEAVAPSVRPSTTTAGRADRPRFAPYLLALPHTLVLLVFLVLPIAAIVVVSFWEFNGFMLVPGFTLDNYTDLLRGAAYRATYLNTLKFAAIVWTITFLVGFPVAYFLAFHVKSVAIRTALFLVCTVPFLTSNIIRSISWIPFLGRNGILNGLLMSI